MSNLDFLDEYFYTGSAETETSFLKDVFVTSDKFYEIIKPRKGSAKILVGNKGSGKSALLEYLYQKSQEQKIPAIRITPAELDELSFEQDISPARVISILQNSIIKTMAIEAGKNVDGILKTDEYRLFQEAVADGQRNASLVTKAMNLLLPIGKALTNINFDELIPKENFTLSSRKRDINSVISDNEVFYVLMDDIDQISNASRTDYYDIIWAEILALLKIAQQLPNVYPIISVRKEIWRKLSSDNGNRDKYDQIRNMVCELNPNRSELISILEQRLKICISKNHLPGDMYSTFFQGRDCKLPRSTERRLWSDYLISSCRSNPRDIIQLVHELIYSARHDNRDIINEKDVEDTAPQYSAERVDDLIKQNKDMCASLEIIIRSFAKVDFELSAEAVKEHLSTVPSQGSIRINGKTIHSDNIDDIFMVWDLLYNIGFLNPRTADNTQPNKYSFLSYDDDKTLVTISRWNDIQKYVWDIHPCYRSYLLNIKDQEQKRALFTEDKANFKGTTTRNQRKKRNRKK